MLSVSRLALLASAVATVAVASAPALAPPTALRVRSSDGNFIDAQGRVVILRGVNVANKVPDFKIVRNNDYKGFIQPLVDLGFNSVRLAFNLEAYAPTPTTRNQAYLREYKRLTEELALRGIYTLVDYHQDIFSRWSLGGCGEGFPQWWVDPALQRTPADQTSQDDLYRKACKVWGIQTVLDETIPATYAPLYNTTGPVQAAFVTLLTEVAARLKTNPYVIGYDIINEPQFISNVNTEVIPLYQRASAAIRSQHPSSIIVYAETRPGLLPHMILPNPNITNSAYTSHVYDGRDAFTNIINQLTFWTGPSFVNDINAKFALAANLPANAAAVGKALLDISFYVRFLFGSLALFSSFPLGPAEGLVLEVQASVQAFAVALGGVSPISPWSAQTIQQLTQLFATLTTKVQQNMIFGLLPSFGATQPAEDVPEEVSKVKPVALSYGSAYILGEFGFPIDSLYNNISFINSAYDSADALFFSTYQWGYFPYWDPILKDNWNLEDFSIVDNKGGFRRNLQAYRPYVPVTAGTPINLKVSFANKTLTYTYTTQPFGCTEIYFPANKLCNRRPARITATPNRNVQCKTLGSYVSCENRRVGNTTVSISC